MTKTRLYTTEALRFSRTWWTDGIKNFLFVATITILIWVYADMDVTESDKFSATIVFTTGTSTDLVLVRPPRMAVDFTLGGTRSALREFKRYLEDHESEIVYDVGPSSLPGTNDARIEDILNKSANLAQREIVLRSATPANVEYELDKRVSRVARIELDKIGADLRGDPKIAPPQITVLMAARDASNIPEGGLVLKTRPLDLSAIPTGQIYSTQLEILPPSTELPVILEQKTVEVTVTVGQRTDVKPFKIAVYLRAPHTWANDGTWNKYEFIKDPLEWQPQITVRGSQKQLQKLQAVDIEAHITLREDDKKPIESSLQRPVTIQFPPGTDLQIVGEAPVVNFKLTPIEPAAPIAPGQP